MVLLLGLPAFASAQQGGPDLRIGAGMVLDFAGSVWTDAGVGPDVDDHLRVTPGLRAHLDYDVHRYIAIGGFTRFSWWRSDNGYDNRNFLWDLGARIQGHYDWRDFRFYLALMPGFALNHFNHDNSYGLERNGPGWTVAVTPGFEWWFSNKAGLFVEMFGWDGHGFRHDAEVGTGSIHVRMNQVLWQFGIVLAP
jgi:hypothetical protein